jgi:hypothetical protein
MLITMESITKESSKVKPTKIKNTKCQQKERKNYYVKENFLPSNIKLIEKDLQIV